MSGFLRDFRFAVQQASRSLVFSLIGVVTLALGIGAATGIFSILEGVLLRPLPFPRPNQLVMLGDDLQGTQLAGKAAVVTGPDIRSYTHDTHLFDAIGGYQPSQYEFSGAGDPYQINGCRTGAGVFQTLDVAPLLGRFFSQDEDDRGEQVTVISYSLWQSHFNGNPGVLGMKALLDRKPYVIIGVMPRSFEFPLVPGHLNQSELWVPLSLTQQELTNAGVASWNFSIIARMKSGVTPSQAQADAQRVAVETMRNYPAFMKGLYISAVVRPLREATVSQARPLIQVLFLAILVVLLIACANLAGLLLVRSIRRRREFAVRLALGAPRSALLRQSVAESLVLSVTGGLLGLILAGLLLRVLVNFMPETLPRLKDIHLDWAVVGFACFLAIATGFFCGIVPGLTASRINVNDSLKEGGRTGSSGSGHARLRSTLVVIEVAVAVVLLAAAGLLLRSFERMRAVDPGFRPDHILVANFSLPDQKYSSQNTIDQFNRELLRRLQQMTGVQEASLTSFLPMSGQGNHSVFVAEGFTPPQGAQLNLAAISLVAGDYFQTMGIHLLRGRFLTQDDNSSPELRVVVNRTLAEHYWPGQDPVRKRLRIGTQEMNTPWLTIVGEVADVKQDAADVETQEQYYQPVEQFRPSLGSLGSSVGLVGNSGYIALRTASSPEMLENLLQRTVHEVDPQLAPAQIESMEQLVALTEAPRRFNTTMVSAFAMAAVLLTLIGLYSVIAFSTVLRRQEMAVRMALGAQRANILWMVFGAGIRLALAGSCIGLLGSVVASGLLRSFVFQVSTYDPMVWVLSAIALIFLALLASLLPAHRAASTNPIEALRIE